MDLTRTWYLRLPCEPFLVLCHLSIGASPGLPTVLCVLYAGASPWFFASLFRGQGSPLVICYPFSLKLFVSTSFSSSHISFYAYSSGNYDQYYTYSTPSSTVYSTTNQQTGNYTGGNGHSYIYMGDGFYPSKYNGTGTYNWGSSVTDVEGNTVASDSPRRGVWTNFVIDAYYQNSNKMPSFKIKTAAALLSVLSLRALSWASVTVIAIPR